MPYIYLKDATPFTADSLNSRVDTLVSDVNVITEDNVQFLALNTVQLPSFVGSAADSSGDTFTSENTAYVVSTPSDKLGNPLRVIGPSYQGISLFGLGFQTTNTSGYTLTLDSAYTLSRSTDQDAPTALLVMANVEVKNFDNIKVISAGAIDDEGTLWGINLNEYTWDATVILELEDSAGDKGYLLRTERQLSPRVTIGAAGNHVTPDPPEAFVIDDVGYLEGRIAMSPLRDLPGHAREPTTADELPVYQQFDHKTFQDVSIRTVITAGDLTRTVDRKGDTVVLKDIEHVRVGLASLNRKYYFTQRANITVVPLIAKVNP